MLGCKLCCFKPALPCKERHITPQEKNSLGNIIFCYLWYEHLSYLGISIIFEKFSMEYEYEIFYKLCYLSVSICWAIFYSCFCRSWPAVKCLIEARRCREDVPWNGGSVTCKAEEGRSRFADQKSGSEKWDDMIDARVLVTEYFCIDGWSRWLFLKGLFYFFSEFLYDSISIPQKSKNNQIAVGIVFLHFSKILAEDVGSRGFFFIV